MQGVVEYVSRQDMGQYSEDSEWEAAEDGRLAQEAKAGRVKDDDYASAGQWHRSLTLHAAGWEQCSFPDLWVQGWECASSDTLLLYVQVMKILIAVTARKAVVHASVAPVPAAASLDAKRCAWNKGGSNLWAFRHKAI